MRAVRCLRHGALADLVVATVPDPIPGPCEVVVDVGAASVNYPDALLVRGEYQIPVPPPFTPGSDFAGTVSAVGTEVDSRVVGDRVFGSAFVGAFAERIVVDASVLDAVPAGVGLEVAAAFPVVYGTAYDALRSTAALQPGETVLVLGAGGGVGLAAVEIASVLGARVIAAASSEPKRAAATSRGATAVVDYAGHDLKVAVKALAPGGVDVVIDPVGGPYAEPALRTLAPGGRFVVVGFASGEIPRIPLNLVLLKGIEIRAYDAARFWRERAEERRRNRVELTRLLAGDRLRPLVSARFPLVETAAALAAVYERRAVGKIVVEPGR